MILIFCWSINWLIFSALSWPIRTFDKTHNYFGFEFLFLTYYFYLSLSPSFSVLLFFCLTVKLSTLFCKLYSSWYKQWDICHRTTRVFYLFSHWPILCLIYSFGQKVSATRGYILNRNVCSGPGGFMVESSFLSHTWPMWCGMDVNITFHFSLWHSYPKSLSFAVLSVFLGNFIVHRTHTNIISIQFRLLCWLFQIYFGTHVIFFAVLFCILFF